MKANKILFALILLIIFSCKKDPVKTTTDYLTTGSWKLIAATSDPGLPISGTVITNLFAQLTPCITDDLAFFKVGGIVTFDQGPTKCDPSNPQSKNGTWILSADEKKITIDGEDSNIIQLDNSTFKTSGIYIDNFIKYTITQTYSH